MDSKTLRNEHEHLKKGIECLNFENKKVLKDNEEFTIAITSLNQKVQELQLRLVRLEQGYKFVVVKQLAFTFERVINNVMGNTKCTPFNTLIDQNKLPKEFEIELKKYYSCADIFEFRDALQELKEARNPFAHANNHDLISCQSIGETEFMEVLDEFYLSLLGSNYSKSDLEPYILFIIQYIKNEQGKFELLNNP